MITIVPRVFVATSMLALSLGFIASASANQDAAAAAAAAAQQQAQPQTSPPGNHLPLTVGPAPGQSGPNFGFTVQPMQPGTNNVAPNVTQGSAGFTFTFR